MLFSSKRPQLDAAGVDAIIPEFEIDARQRPARRPRDRPPALHVELAFVARAAEALVLRLRHHRARQVCASLAVGDILVLVEPHQQATVVRLRVSERLRAADRQLVDAGNLDEQRVAAPTAEEVLNPYTELPDRE